jgi:hypothetical protein
LGGASGVVAAATGVVAAATGPGAEGIVAAATAGSGFLAPKLGKPIVRLHSKFKSDETDSTESPMRQRFNRNLNPLQKLGGRQFQEMGTRVALAVALLATQAVGSRPHVSFSFINSPLAPRDLHALLPAGRDSALVSMSGSGVELLADTLGGAIAQPIKLLVKLAMVIGRLVPDRLPHWWEVRGHARAAPRLEWGSASARCARSRVRGAPLTAPHARAIFCARAVAGA